MLLKLSIIIINYNAERLLQQCLTSVFEDKGDIPLEVIVINNNYSDKSFKRFIKQFSEVRFIQNDKNLGFARSVNLGLNYSKGNYVLVLNPDIVVLSNAFNEMLKFMDDHPDAGLISAKLLNPDGSLQYSCRTFYDIKTLLYRRTLLRWLLPNSIERRHLLLDWDHNEVREVEWVLGTCMMVRRDAIKGVGVLDERFFMYFEDVDWCKRMKKKGWKVFYVPHAQMIHHHMRQSAKRGINRAKIEHFKSMCKFLIKYRSRISYFV